MKSNLIPCIKLTLVCLLFFSGFYTAVVYGIAQFVPNNGKGFIVKSEMSDVRSNKSDSADIMLATSHNVKTTFYYENIGQKFTVDRYFYSRPSAVDYNAANSAGSNKGPSNPEYLSQVQARIDTFLVHNPGVNKSEIPCDLITASGSGLDPNISVQAATVQIKRISKLRGIPEANLQQLILSTTEAPLFGLFGPEKINVLKLNIELDKIKH